MKEIMFSVINMSISGGIVILAILLARLILKKAPKKWSYLLWGAAAFRLCCPVSIKSAISLFSFVPKSAESAEKAASAAGRLEYIPNIVRSTQIPVSAATPPPTPTHLPAFTPSALETGVPTAAINGAAASPSPTHGVIAGMTENIGGAGGAGSTAQAVSAVSLVQALMTAAVVLWIVGMIALVAYSVIGYIRIYRKMSAAVRLEGNVYQSEHVRSPFILGLIRPKIYIPYGLDAESESYVLAHERFHLKRGDHIIKVFSFLLLALHWFNPLCWLAFCLSNKDMEMSCDEKVLGDKLDIRKQYSSTLLSFAACKQFPSASPLAFGESGVKSRIKNAMNYKKPRFFVTVIALVISLAVLAACVVNPTDNGVTPDKQEANASAEPTNAPITEAPTSEPTKAPETAKPTAKPTATPGVTERWHPPVIDEKYFYMSPGYIDLSVGYDGVSTSFVGYCTYPQFLVPGDSPAWTQIMRVNTELSMNALAEYGELVKNADELVTYFQTAYVRRADEGFVSLLFKKRAEGITSYSSVNIDVEAGKTVVLGDIVENIADIPRLINERLDPETGVRLSEDYTAYFGPEKDGIAWSLDRDGIYFVIAGRERTPEEVYEGGEDRIWTAALIPYSELTCKTDLTPRTEDGVLQMPYDLPVLFAEDGEIRALSVNSVFYMEIDGPESTSVKIEYMGESKEVGYTHHNNEMYHQEGGAHLVYSGGKKYLYLMGRSRMPDEESIRVFDLGGNEPLKKAIWTDCELTLREILIDPASFRLGKYTSVLGNKDFFRRYAVGKDGYPVPIENYYYRAEMSDSYLKVLKPIEAIEVDSNTGEVIGPATIKAGVSLTFIQTTDYAWDAETNLQTAYCVVYYVEGDIHKYIIRVDKKLLDAAGSFKATVNGEDIFSVFNGLDFGM